MCSLLLHPISRPGLKQFPKKRLNDSRAESGGPERDTARLQGIRDLYPVAGAFKNIGLIRLLLRFCGERQRRRREEGNQEPKPIEITHIYLLEDSK